jgi:type I restriction enzyme M protein
VACYLIQTPEAHSQARLGQLHVCEIIHVFKVFAESERGEETLTVESTPQVAFIPVGKIRCYVTGELRNDTPEEHVRQRIARSLAEEYGYPKEDIALEYRINVGRARRRVDIAVFMHGRSHAQDSIILIAETKREEIKPTDRDNGVDQLKSYLAACFNAKWGLWVGSELQAHEVVIEGGQRKSVDVADLPPYGKTQAPRITFDQLLPAEGLRDVFKRCHNYIYANQGKPKDQAFHDLLKLIFCKVHDEQTTAGDMRFDVTTDERRSTLGQRRLRQHIEELKNCLAKSRNVIPTSSCPMTVSN